MTVIRQEIFTKISVKDNGKGIRLERQAEIFTRFYREPEVHVQNGGNWLIFDTQDTGIVNGYIKKCTLKSEKVRLCLYLPN